MITPLDPMHCLPDLFPVHVDLRIFLYAIPTILVIYIHLTITQPGTVLLQRLGQLNKQITHAYI